MHNRFLNTVGKGAVVYTMSILTYSMYVLTAHAQTCSAGQLCNPLKVTTITEFLVAIIDILLIFALPVIIFFIIYSGYLFVTAGGDSGQIEKARGSLTWAIIGGVIILGAKLIITVVQNTVAAI